jgi:hypothetical protein
VEASISSTSTAYTWADNYRSRKSPHKRLHQPPDAKQARSFGPRASGFAAHENKFFEADRIAAMPGDERLQYHRAEKAALAKASAHAAVHFEQI